MEEDVVVAILGHMEDKGCATRHIVHREVRCNQGHTIGNLVALTQEDVHLLTIIEVVTPVERQAIVLAGLQRDLGGDEIVVVIGSNGTCLRVGHTVTMQPGLCQCRIIVWTHPGPGVAIGIAVNDLERLEVLFIIEGLLVGGIPHATCREHV